MLVKGKASETTLLSEEEALSKVLGTLQTEVQWEALWEQGGVAERINTYNSDGYGDLGIKMGEQH